MHKESTKLEVLESLEKTIWGMSRRVFLKHLKLDRADLVQEGILKVLHVIDTYTDDTPVVEMVPECITALQNLYKKIIRMDYSQCRVGIELDLEKAYNLADRRSLGDIYVNCQLGELREIFDEDENKILDCLLLPDAELLEMAERHFTTVQTQEVRITNKLIGQYLQIGRIKVSRMLSVMRVKAEPILGY